MEREKGIEAKKKAKMVRESNERIQKALAFGARRRTATAAENDVNWPDATKSLADRLLAEAAEQTCRWLALNVGGHARCTADRCREQPPTRTPQEHESDHADDDDGRGER